MKIQQDVREQIAKAIEPLDTQERRQRYLDGNFDRAYAVSDLDKRYRWDLFWTVRPHLAVSLHGLKDTHIDTVLRKIVAPLERKPLDQVKAEIEAELLEAKLPFPCDGQVTLTRTVTTQEQVTPDKGGNIPSVITNQEIIDVGETYLTCSRCGILADDRELQDHGVSEYWEEV